MANDMNAFELSDEQLAEITGAGGGITISPQINVATNVQLNNIVSPTTGIVVGVGDKVGLNLKGADFHVGNTGLLSGINKQ
jgi:hypothetical protein